MGGTLLVGVVVFGAAVAGDHSPTVVDQWGMTLVSHFRGGPWTDISKLGTPVVSGTSIVICAAVALGRGWRHVAACLVAPLAAVVLVEVMKTLFQRLDEGVSSYPSGSVAVVASAAGVAVMVSEPKWRGAMAALAAAVVIAMAVAVVALRWHYPTDALAGAALGISVVIIADGLIRLSDRSVPSGSEEPHGRSWR